PSVAEDICVLYAWIVPDYLHYHFCRVLGGNRLTPPTCGRFHPGTGENRPVAVRRHRARRERTKRRRSMKQFRLGRLFALCAVVAVTACAGVEDTPSGTAPGDGTSRARVQAQIATVAQYPHKRVCPASTEPGFAACLARVRVTADGQIAAGLLAPNATPNGFGPADLQSAYKVNPTLGAGATIAIVDAQDDPNAESDLGVYRSQYGLPPCTTANGCFKKVNQNGAASPLPTPDKGWASESMLDLDMASAICPNCKLLLVEANSASMTNLGTAVNRAVTMGATVVSNSYGGPEDASIPSADTAYFNHPGVAIFVSSGDNGYGVEYPAS